MNRIVHGNTHFPLVRDRTMRYWQQCENMISAHSTRVVAGDRPRPYLLTTDMNDHSGDLFNPKGFHRLGGKGIDYIGVRLPEGWKLAPSDKGRKQSITVLERKQVNGTIDNHDFYGVKLLVVFEDGTETRFWLVQANLGRGEPASEFTNNVKRLKRAFPAPVSFGLQEIDEADRPEEHELLRKQFPTARMVGWGTMNPLVTRRIKVLNARIDKACDGLAKYHPMRMLVEGGLDWTPREGKKAV